MTKKRPGPAPGVRLIEVAVKRQLTVFCLTNFTRGSLRSLLWRNQKQKKLSTWIKKRKKQAQRRKKYHHSVRKRRTSLLKATNALGLGKSLRRARHLLKKSKSTPVKVANKILLRNLTEPMAKKKKKKKKNATVADSNTRALSIEMSLSTACWSSHLQLLRKRGSKL